MFSEGGGKEGAFLAGRSAVLRPWSQREHRASGSSGGSQTQEGKDPCQREATGAGGQMEAPRTQEPPKQGRGVRCLGCCNHPTGL